MTQQQQEEANANSPSHPHVASTAAAQPTGVDGPLHPLHRGPPCWSVAAVGPTDTTLRHPSSGPSTHGEPPKASADERGRARPTGNGTLVGPVGKRQATRRPATPRVHSGRVPGYHGDAASGRQSPAERTSRKAARLAPKPGDIDRRTWAGSGITPTRPRPPSGARGRTAADESHRARDSTRSQPNKSVCSTSPLRLGLCRWLERNVQRQEELWEHHDAGGYD
ncbi:unnamed protein product [Lampetra fluviatilis]